MNKIKLIATIVISLLAAVIILQNTQPIETRILFFTLTLPRALLLFFATLIGFVMGMMTVLRHTKPARGQGSQPPETKP